MKTNREVVKTLLFSFFFLVFYSPSVTVGLLLIHIENVHRNAAKTIYEQQPILVRRKYLFT